MLRRFVFSMLMLPCLGLSQSVIQGQGPALVQKDRTRALDGAAMTPFFTKKGADAVKNVIAGGAARKAEESVLDPARQPQLPGIPMPQPGQGFPVQQAKPTIPVAPVAAPTFNWRLVGISYGKRDGMALFQADGKSMSACIGSALDPDTKILSVSRSEVVVSFHGKRLELTPW